MLILNRPMLVSGNPLQVSLLIGVATSLVWLLGCDSNSPEENAVENTVAIRDVDEAVPSEEVYSDEWGSSESSYANNDLPEPNLETEILEEDGYSNERRSAKNAEEFLSQIKNENPGYFNSPPDLSMIEIGKVVAQLRDEFPFVSLRDRMRFQAEHPEPPKPDTQAAGWSERYANALSEIHSDNVVKFIESEGQGVSRSVPVGPRDLYSWQRGEVASLRQVPADSDLLNEAPLELDKKSVNRKSWSGKEVPDHRFVNVLDPRGMPKEQLLSSFNGSANSLFAENAAYVKSIDEVAGFKSHRIWLPEQWNQDLRVTFADGLNSGFFATENKDGIYWRVNRLQLVSLLIHDEPSVYVTDELPNMETLSGTDVETRGLDEFETNGLAKLKSGDELFVHATKNRITMMGSVRADVTCLQCHNVKADDLLGAFSYEFLRDPRVK